MADKYQPDSMDWTPLQAAEELVDELRKNNWVSASGVKMGAPDKALLICLWDNDDGFRHYATIFRNAGMTLSECVALCEIIKQKFLTEICASPTTNESDDES